MRPLIFFIVGMDEDDRVMKRTNDRMVVKEL